MKFKVTNMSTLGIISLIFLALPAISLIVNTFVLVVKYVTRIAEGSMVMKMMRQSTEPALIYTYIFNITNAEEFLAGDQKLKIEEVGPFTYQEHRQVEDVELDETDSVLRYTSRSRIRFVPEDSIGDPRHINVTVANIASLAIASKVSSYPYLTKAAFNIFTRQKNSKTIINMSADKFLWRFQDPLVTISPSVLPWWVNLDSFGPLSLLFEETSETRMEMGISNGDKFQIKTVDQAPGLRERGYDNPSKRTRCNTFEDTYEGRAFPMALTPRTPLRLYRKKFCRILDLEYSAAEVDHGLRVFKYKFNNGTFGATPSTECLCSGDCKNGVTDLAPCYSGLGIALSNAHFLYANPELYEHIDGIRPDEHKHGSEVVVDAISGMSVKTKISLQINVLLEDLSFSQNFKRFSNMVIPLAYFQIVEPEMREDMKETLMFLYNVGPWVVHGVEGMCATLGAGVLLYIVYVKCHLSGRAMSYHTPEAAIKRTDCLTDINIPPVDFTKLRIIE